MALVSEKDNTVSVRLPAQLKDAVNRLANKRGCSASDIIREAVMKHVPIQPTQHNNETETK